MEKEAYYSPGAKPLYNEAYLTPLGTKTIDLNGTSYEVHETSNLRLLLDAHFHRQAGIVPANFLEEMTATKLDNPALDAVLNEFFRQNPELTTVLESISQQRDMEYRARTRLRERLVRRTSGEPSDKENFRRDFIYSQVLDYIGDMTTGTDFDLTLLTK